MDDEELWEIVDEVQSEEFAHDVRVAATAVTHHDGVSPLNEEALRGLIGQVPAEHLAAREVADQQAGALLGYAQVDLENGTAQAFVLPEHRRRGVGRALAEALNHRHEGLQWWSFGTLLPAVELADCLGLTPRRALLKLVMADPAAAEDSAPPATGSPAVITGFTPADIDDLVEVNHLAFAEHPEQGAMTRADVEDKMAEDWFDADGLLLARDRDDGRLLGFHWTKIVPEPRPGGESRSIGEVYVIGVHPSAGGRGLGRALLDAGLAHLRHRGVDEIELYVEADNTRAAQMYGRAGFTESRRDTCWS